MTRVSAPFLFTLMVSALFCAESAAPENAMAQMMVKILLISYLLILRQQRYGKRMRKFFQKNRYLLPIPENRAKLIDILIHNHEFHLSIGLLLIIKQF